MVDELPSPEEMHTNIVAGFVSDDGRTVMARLPRAEAEVEAFALPTMPPGIFASTTPREFDRGGFTLIRGDGLSVEAKFVGLDASTGLSLLEAAEPLVAPAPKALVGVPSIGQRVRLYAPAPATPPPAAVAMPAPAAPPAVAAGETGDTGVIYVGIGETEGQLTAVKRAPSGLPLAATVKATRITPAWAGAVVTNAAGELVGIAGDSGDTESQVVPAEVVRQAKERVLARRASVPQPWLGVRGDAVSRTTVEQFLAQGWPREFARSLLNERRGLLLTSVAPDTPAALAGLRPGDVISRVGEIDVRGVEDFSMLIREAGAGAKLNMTVLRALTNAPLKFTVELRGTKDPAQAMADAMAWARPNALAPYGVETVGLTARVASRLGASGGLLVVHVREESPAASAGLKAWDVIETVNGAPVTWVQWPRPTPGADGDVNLGVVRDGQKMKFALKRMEE
jgi:S1-C subfamily serine protease